MTARKSKQGAEHLGGDRYRVRRYIPDRGDGKPGQRSRNFHAPNQRTADRMAAGEYVKLDAEIADAAAKAGTLAGLCERYEAHKLPTWSPSTADAKVRHLKAIRADLGHHHLDQLTAEHVDGWYAVLRKRGLGEQSVKHYATTLGAVLRQGERWDKATMRAHRNATPPKPAKVPVRVPPAPVVALLMSTATGALRVALALAAYVGARRGEIMGLRWSDFDGHQLTIRRSVLDRPHGEVFVKSTKSGRERTLTVDQALLEELAVWRAEQLRVMAAIRTVPVADWFVFADWRKDESGQRPQRPGWLSLAWSRHRAAHGAQGVRLHHLRHWNASTLLDAGVPLPVVSGRLGHADSATTARIYAHALEAADVATRGMLTAALQPEQGDTHG